ncbi:hypothetical protein AHAS_Ahas13G0348400 [Arachis hypogaea]
MLIPVCCPLLEEEEEVEVEEEEAACTQLNPGDVIEVCRYYSWKLAIVLRQHGQQVCSGNPVENSMVFLLNKFYNRVRQPTQDERWSLFG